MPCLLLRNAGLVKTVKFRNPAYVGDPVNAVRIFNEMEVDELIFLDIAATPERRPPPFELLAQIASECFMPFAYGGGVRSVDDMRGIFRIGVEKVCVNTRAIEDFGLVSEAAHQFGSQSIVAAIDVKRTLFGRYRVRSHGGRRNAGLDPVEHARRLQQAGAGELLLTSMDRDGTMSGYDLDLIRTVAAAVDIPVIACGGAGKPAHFREAVDAGAAAVAAGSMVVYQGRGRGVLINFPTPAELRAVLD